MRFLKGMLLILVVLSLTGCCDAETFKRWGVPGHTFSSKDMSLVKVNFARCNFDSPANCVQKIAKVMEVPRAYIISALPYKKNEHCVVPDEIYVGKLHLGINYPDDKPVTVKRNLNSAIGTARFHDMFVDVAYSVKSKIDFSPRKMNTLHRTFSTPIGAGKLDGESWRNLQRYGGRNYLGNAGEGVVNILCSGRIEKTRKDKYFTYTAVLGDGVLVHASFIDFRLNGDLEMARERMRVIRKTVCGLIDCKQS